MTKSALMASTAVGLLLCIAPANAQTRGGDEKAAPSQQREPGAAQKESPVQQGEPKQKAEPKGKAAQGDMKEQPGKGATQTKPSDGKGAAEKAVAAVPAGGAAVIRVRGADGSGEGGYELVVNDGAAP